MEKNDESRAKRCTEYNFILLDSLEKCWSNLDTVLMRDGYMPRPHNPPKHTHTHTVDTHAASLGNKFH